MSSKFAFDKKADAFKAAKKQAAIEIVQASKKYFTAAFENEGLGTEKWAEVARRMPGNPFNERRIVSGRNKASGKTFTIDQGDDYATRKILQGTSGRLKYKTENADTSITNDGTTSVIKNPVPYADYAFNGTPYMPARPNMKQTDELTTIQLRILTEKTGKIWQIK